MQVVLIMVKKKYQLSNDHIELTFATNMIGPYFMTQLLRDTLKKIRCPKNSQCMFYQYKTLL